MRSYLSGLRVNITLIFMSSSSYLVHAISCRRILLKKSLFVMFISFFLFLVSTFFIFFILDGLTICQLSPTTRHLLPVTRYPSPVTRGKVLPIAE